MNKRAGDRDARLTTAILIVILLPSLILASGCAGIPSSAPPAPSPQLPAGSPVVSWKDTMLPDLQGRGNISISGFAGKAVLVPILSVSCPGCIVQLNRQLEETGRLEQGSSGRIAVVALDLDPATGPGYIASYGAPVNFSGYSVRSPPDMTLELFHRFGPFSIDTPAIPVILVCPDGRDFLLPPGLKTAESLNESIQREC